MAATINPTDETNSSSSNSAVKVNVSAAPEGRRPTGGSKGKMHILPRFAILVDCHSEKEQKELYQRLAAEGWACRVLTL